MEGAFLSIFEDFFKNPSDEKFVTLCKAFFETQYHDPYNKKVYDIIPLVNKFIKDGNYDQALEELMSIMPNMIMNPNAHVNASDICRKLGRAVADPISGLI